MQKPLIVLTLSYVAGLLLGHALLFFPRTVTVPSLLAFLALLALTSLGRFPLKRFLLVTLPCLAGAAAYLFSAVWVPADHYTRLPGDGGAHVITGTIASPLDRDPDRTAFVLSLDRVDDRSISGKARVTVRAAATLVGYGDRIRFPGKLFEPHGFGNPGGFDYGTYLAQSGIARTASIRDAAGIEVLERGRGVFRAIQDRRERIRQAFLASLSGPGAAILQAMVLGEEGALTDDMRDRFMAAGVTHIISISGSHLGMLALICFGFMRLVMRAMPEAWYHRLTLVADPKKIAAWMTLPLVLFYTLLAGGQMATVRSFVMITAAMTALLLDRENALLHALATAALFILIANPQALFDISFQLSFISVWTIGSIVLLWTELQVKPAGRVGRIASRALLLAIISVSTGLATGPLAARYFNQVSMAGLLSNMIVVPFAGMLVVPVGLLSGVLSLFSSHLPLAGLNQLLADTFIGTVTFFAGLPFAEFHPPAPGNIWLCCYALFIGSAFALVRANLRARFKPFESSARVSRGSLTLALVSAVLLALLSLRPLFPPVSAEVWFPDVGQGDAALIRLPHGRNILIDGGGTYDDRFDVGRRVLAPFLWNKGVRSLDLVVLSHPHPDHMNGLKFILQKFPVAEIWTHGMDEDLPGYGELMRIASERKVRQRIVATTDAPVFVGPAELQALHPSRAFRSRERKDYSAENDRSLVLRVALAGRVLLFAGDIGKGAEEALLRSGTNVKCDLLKVPHHGSKSSSSVEFIHAAGPELAVFTVGRGNRYRHPSGEVVEEYHRAGAHVLRTDEDGALGVIIAEGKLRYTRWSEREVNRIGLTGTAADEGENWKRVWVRIWEL